MLDYKHEVTRSLVHTVERHHYLYPGGRDMLIKGVKTKPGMGGGATTTCSSFMGGLFHLIKGDKIVVGVSNVNRLSPVPQSSYLGLFKL